jgi:hypothetical protein
MADLREDIAAFDRMQSQLEAEHFHEWAVFREGKLAGVYHDFEAAAEDAIERFDDGPYLIRQIGAGPVQFSGGMIMRPVHANGASGV